MAGGRVSKRHTHVPTANVYEARPPGRCGVTRCSEHYFKMRTFLNFFNAHPKLSWLAHSCPSAPHSFRPRLWYAILLLTYIPSLPTQRRQHPLSSRTAFTSCISTLPWSFVQPHALGACPYRLMASPMGTATSCSSQVITCVSIV
jgi:hypothetical protein